MKISAINAYASPRCSSKVLKHNEKQTTTQSSFKGLKGATVGAALGYGGITALTLAETAFLISNPIGWGTAALMYFGSIGTIGASGYAGHKIEEALKK